MCHQQAPHRQGCPSCQNPHLHLHQDTLLTLHPALTPPQTPQTLSTPPTLTHLTGFLALTMTQPTAVAVDPLTPIPNTLGCPATTLAKATIQTATSLSMEALTAPQAPGLLAALRAAEPTSPQEDLQSLGKEQVCGCQRCKASPRVSAWEHGLS